MSESTLRKANKIIEALVDAALEQGHSLSVSTERGYDLDDMLLGSTDRKAILDEATTGDDCHLFIHERGKPAVKERVLQSAGWVLIIPSSGEDVITDYSANQTTDLLVIRALAVGLHCLS